MQNLTKQTERAKEETKDQKLEFQPVGWFALANGVSCKRTVLRATSRDECAAACLSERTLFKELALSLKSILAVVGGGGRERRR